MKKENNDTNSFAVTSYNVIRAHEFKDGNIAFDLKINGITLYNLTLVWYKKEKRYFISFPSKKVDDKYYNHYWFPVEDDLLAGIKKEIEDLLS